MNNKIFIINLLVICLSLISCSNRADNSIEHIQKRGVLLVGTTGDYKPLTYKDSLGIYQGKCIDLAREIAKELNVGIDFVPTTWPDLTADVLSQPAKFDFAIGGITITDKRLQKMLMSDGYMSNGKTILCRSTDSHKYKSLNDIDNPEVKVMINPGGTNEEFAKSCLKNSTLLYHQQNDEIPFLIAEGKADIMITEIVEANYYTSIDSRLAAPLVNTPFTQSQIGVLMRKGQDDLLQFVNSFIRNKNSSLAEMPSDFVYVSDVIPDVLLEIRYFSTYNFIGDRIPGYYSPVAIMTRQSADSLKVVSDELKAKGYVLKIYDAYRPQCAVDYFMKWATDTTDTRMKESFYPELDKSILVPQEYVARRSSHTRGSTVDLTLVNIKTGREVDMGCVFDYFGLISHPDVRPGQIAGAYKPINEEQYRNRMILQKAMLSHGFKPYECEWWHFTLKDEPYPDTYFNFPVYSPARQ